jgi:hypothetical protein
MLKEDKGEATSKSLKQAPGKMKRKRTLFAAMEGSWELVRVRCFKRLGSRFSFVKLY